MKTQKLMPPLLYVGIFAGIPLAIIVALFFLPVLNSVDPTAIVILIIFTVLVVTLWLFVPREEPVTRKRTRPKDRKATVKRAVPAPIEALEELTSEEKKRKARSRRPLYKEDEKREPFVDVVEKSTQHPAAQPQVRRKAQSKARKKSAKKKKR
jgi:hypothetical protein